MHALDRLYHFFFSFFCKSFFPDDYAQIDIIIFQSQRNISTLQTRLIHGSSMKLQPLNLNSISLEKCILLFDSLIKYSDVECNGSTTPV